MTNKLMELRDYMEAYEGVLLPLKHVKLYVEELYSERDLETYGEYSIEEFLNECLKEYK